MRRRLSLVVVLLLPAACARPGQGVTPEAGRLPAVRAPASSPAPPAPRCIDGVEITVGETDAAMGLRATGVELRNCGTTPYTVDGYPDLELLGDDRKPLDVRVLHGVGEVAMIEQWAVEPKPVTGAPGEHVTAVLVWRNLTTDAETIATAEYVHVAPAAGRPRHIVAHHVDTGNTGKVAVSPWVRAEPPASATPS